jgi:spectinomycin phosphotransferase
VPLCHHLAVLEDPGLPLEELSEAIRTSWGIAATSITFVPGHDMQAASYEAVAGDETLFLKVRFGPVREAALAVPNALRDAGVPNIPAPLPTGASTLWAPMGDRKLILYPFIRGQSAMELGLDEAQWRTFGETLRAIHDSGLEYRFSQMLPAETFEIPAAASVRQILEAAEHPPRASEAGRRLAKIYRREAARIDATVARAQELGERLRGRSFDRVLCHADIHANNILVGDEGNIHLVDWDGPMIAPRERDLWFVIGSTIARATEPHEEAWFFEGYGPVKVDREAIVYYRYERFLEDLAEFGRTVFIDPLPTDTGRMHEVDLTEWYFGPDSLLATAEEVTVADAAGLDSARK